MTHFNLITVKGILLSAFFLLSILLKRMMIQHTYDLYMKTMDLSFHTWGEPFYLLYGTTNLYPPSKMMTLFSQYNCVFFKPDHHFRWISWDLRMRWLFRAKNTIKIRSKKSHVDHGGKWHIAAYWCSFTTKFKKNKNHCWVLSIHKNMKNKIQKE